jgi:hypothetical protein
MVKLYGELLWQENYYLESTYYALHIVDDVTKKAPDCSKIDDYLENGTPADFVPTKEENEIRKIHKVYEKQTRYKNIFHPFYRPKGTMYRNKKEHTFKCRMYHLMSIAISTGNPIVLRHLKTNYFDKREGREPLIDITFKPSDTAYELFDLTVEVWTSMRLLYRRLEIDIRLNPLTEYTDNFYMMLEMGYRDEYALRHFAKYLTGCEEYGMIDKLVKCYSFNLSYLLYYCAITDHLRVFNDLINKFKYWVDYSCLVDAMDYAHSIGNNYIRRMICDKMLRLGPYIFIPLTKEYPEFMFHYLFFRGMQAYDKMYGMEKNPNGSGYLMTKDIVKFCNDYIQNHSHFSAIDLMEQPVVGYTWPNHHYTSTKAVFPTNVYGEAEIKEVDPLNKPGRIDNFSEEMGVTEDGGELYPLSRGPIPPEALEHAKAKYAKQLAEEEERQKEEERLAREKGNHIPVSAN